MLIGDASYRISRPLRLAQAVTLPKTTGGGTIDKCYIYCDDCALCIQITFER
jgi:hypothetical protein